jgi:choline dehydrogenase
MRDVVDYIVVGAGTAGCIMANRLSVDVSTTVALMEFGGMDTNPDIYDRDIDAMYRLWDPEAEENWGYSTVPQVGLNGRVIDIARGKVLGGCSAVNAMMHVRGHRRDYDRWAALGNKGWGYDDVLPYFKKMETYHGPKSEYHGDNGPMSLIDIRNPNPILDALMEAHVALGNADTKYNDFNGAVQEAGAGLYQTSRSPSAIRVTEGSAYVTPILDRENFTLMTCVRATKILIEGGRAVGIEYQDVEGTKTLRAAKEVVLCAGAFETPKLMMLSGLGPADHLREHGIEVVQDMPGLGQNLHDHLLLGTAYESIVDLRPPELAAEAGLFMWTPEGPKDESPNLQYFFGPVLQPSLMELAPEGMSPTRGFTFTAVLNRPLSRGTLKLASANPADHAVVDPQYLTREEDLAVLEFAIRYSRELCAQSAFDQYRGIEIAPGQQMTESAELREFAKNYCGTVWHPVGTTKMGNDDMSVVDDTLKVYGIDGLRVTDASIMPEIVNANPNAAIMMIAEKAADLMRSGQ